MKSLDILKRAGQNYTPMDESAHVLLFYKGAKSQTGGNLVNSSSYFSRVSPKNTQVEVFNLSPGIIREALSLDLINSSYSET